MGGILPIPKMFPGYLSCAPVLEIKPVALYIDKCSATNLRPQPGFFIRALISLAAVPLLDELCTYLFSDQTADFSDLQLYFLLPILTVNLA